jgi:hypothetical protein
MAAAVGAAGGRLYSLACFVHTVELLPTTDGDKENSGGAGGVAHAVGCAAARPRLGTAELRPPPPSCSPLLPLRRWPA